MKVIAKTVNGFLLEATFSEIVNLVGYYSHYDNGAPKEERIKIGDEIAISTMFNQLYNLKRQEGKMHDAAVILRNYADLMEIANPIIKVKLPEETKP